jgi:pyruvate/2-oxoglutarate dehydrogenase complex dihydrolipoamide acyltransferase (E2) component
MRVDVVVPQMGEAVSEVTLSAWLKKPGDRVRKGEPLFQVDMDKAVIDVEAFDDGVLAEVLVEAGTGVTPQTVVARLEVAGAPSAAGMSAASPAGAASVSTTSAGPAAIAGAASSSAPRAAGGNVSPRARRLAESLGVDLAAVAGTGPGGMVTEQDVRKAAGGAPGAGG